MSFRCVRSPDAPKMTRHEASGTRSCSRPSRRGFASIAGAITDMLRPPRKELYAEWGVGEEEALPVFSDTRLLTPDHSLLRRLHLLRHLLRLGEDAHEVVAHDLADVAGAVAAAL